MPGWIWDYLKGKLEEGKVRGEELKKKHKSKIKEVFKKEKDKDDDS